MTPMRVALMAALLTGCTSAETPAPATGLFVVVHIPEGLVPLERAAKYEDPLGDALQNRHAGEVSGGGTQIARRADGSQAPVAVDIDVDLVDALHGLPALREEMRKLDPPPGTELSYTGLDGRHVREAL